MVFSEVYGNTLKNGYQFPSRHHFLYFAIVFSIETEGDDPFLQDESHSVLHIDSLGHVLYAFINGELAGNKTELLRM